MVPRFLKHRNFFLTLLFIALVTPTQIDLNRPDLAPSIFVFMYDLILERDFSLRPLRPLALTLHISGILTFILIHIKRRFFLLIEN